MRKTMMAAAIGSLLSALALAQSPSTSARLPDGAVPPDPGEIVLGNGCPCLSGTPEGEADCGLPDDTVNGGCNSVPFVFSSIAPGESVCGTAGVDETLNGGTRDTDWYEYTVTETATYTWNVRAEFPALLGIIDASLGCGAPTLMVFDLADGCGDPGAVSLELTPGTYWFFVAPSFFSPSLTCGSEYTADLFGGYPPAQAIPAVGQLGLGAIALLLAGLAFVLLRRRRAAAA